MTGIYKITNNVNNKVYIGQSVNIASRWKEHLCKPFNPNDSSYNSYFYKAIRKYGIENFSFSIVEQCEKNELNDKEQYWIRFYQSCDHNFGYNLTSGGEGLSSCGKYLDQQSVDEIKQLLLTTDITQWDIARKFCVNQSIISYINSGENWNDANLTYPLRPKSKNHKYFCPDCGDPVSTQGNRCVACNAIANRKCLDRPSKEQLTKLLIEHNGNFSEIGRMYDVSDVAIRKWCKSYNMPYHSHDYAKPK